MSRKALILNCYEFAWGRFDWRRRAGHIWIITLRDIAAGEEVTFDYGYDLEDYREHSCRCGAPGCVGFIVAAELRDQVSKKCFPIFLAPRQEVCYKTAQRSGTSMSETATKPAGKLPPQTKFIVGNEACERFSFRSRTCW